MNNEEKAKMYEKLKHKRKGKEWDYYFLRYTPGKDKETKKTRKRRKATKKKRRKSRRRRRTRGFFKF